jgi:hypothetical protein
VQCPSLTAPSCRRACACATRCFFTRPIHIHNCMPAYDAVSLSDGAKLSAFMLPRMIRGFVFLSTYLTRPTHYVPTVQCPFPTAPSCRRSCARATRSFSTPWTFTSTRHARSSTCPMPRRVASSCGAQCKVRFCLKIDIAIFLGGAQVVMLYARYISDATARCIFVWRAIQGAVPVA